MSCEAKRARMGQACVIFRSLNETSPTSHTAAKMKMFDSKDARDAGDAMTVPQKISRKSPHNLQLFPKHTRIHDILNLAALPLRLILSKRPFSDCCK